MTKSKSQTPVREVRNVSNGATMQKQNIHTRQHSTGAVTTFDRPQDLLAKVITDYNAKSIDGMGGGRHKFVLSFAGTRDLEALATYVMESYHNSGEMVIVGNTEAEREDREWQVVDYHPRLYRTGLCFAVLCLFHYPSDTFWLFRVAVSEGEERYSDSQWLSDIAKPMPTEQLVTRGGPAPSYGEAGRLGRVHFDGGGRYLWASHPIFHVKDNRGRWKTDMFPVGFPKLSKIEASVADANQVALYHDDAIDSLLQEDGIGFDVKPRRNAPQHPKGGDQ